MLTPEYLDSLPEPVLELFRQVEEDILEDMARRISKMGAVTETADWQRWRLEQIQLTRSDITERLSKLTGLTQQELRKLFQEAATQAVQTDNEIYRAAGLSPGSPNDSPELLQLLNGGMQQTSGTFQNLTRTTANTAIISPHSSHSIPKTRSVSAADTRWSHPSPGPTPMRPPEAAADMVRVC